MKRAAPTGSSMTAVQPCSQQTMGRPVTRLLLTAAVEPCSRHAIRRMVSCSNLTAAIQLSGRGASGCGCVPGPLQPGTRMCALEAEPLCLLRTWRPAAGHAPRSLFVCFRRRCRSFAAHIAGVFRTL
eukprot:359816-Chlamydomonas_euryale.AAC.1